MARADLISIEDIPDEIRNYQVSSTKEMSTAPDGQVSKLELKDATIEAEKRVIQNALIKSNYNKSMAARLLKIDRKTLYNKIKQLDIPLRSQ
jgi:two-component system response regulator HydG